MPQIANQDYIYIVPKPGRAAFIDAACLAQLKKATQIGTIWDCIIKFPYSEEAPNWSKVIGLYDYDIYIFDTYNADTNYIEVPCTVDQYEALSAIQLAEDVRSGETIQTVPVLSTDTYLMDDEQGVLVCVDDYKLIATDSGGNLVELSVSQDKVDPESDSWVNITWEDAQKLIGLPLA